MFILSFVQLLIVNLALLVLGIERLIVLLRNREGNRGTFMMKSQFFSMNFCLTLAHVINLVGEEA